MDTKDEPTKLWFNG